MKVRKTLIIASAVLSCAAFAHAKSVETYLYTPVDPSGFTVVTHDDELPILQYMDLHYGIAEISEHPALSEGVLAEVTYANGNTTVIDGSVQGSSTYGPAQTGSFPPIANTCSADELSAGSPYVITSDDLPYQQTFDTTGATDSGDFRGTAADSISRPGGHDGFWRFTPAESGTYVFSNFATKGDAAPIPDHDFERGFGGIGVWSGECGSLVEVGTANSIIGDSILPVTLEAGTTYTVVWEDYFIGSTENSVRLTVEYLGGPEGNTLNESISLVDTGWNFEVSGDTTPYQNLTDSSCIEPPEGGPGHGPGSGELTGSEIWYRLPAATPGTEYTINVLSPSEDSTLVDTALVLHAYNVTTHQVAEVHCNNDISEENRLSSITFTAEQNLIYYVMVETVPAFDQRSFGQFMLQGLAQTSSVKTWKAYE